MVVAAWATRIPAVQERLALTPGSFAVAVLLLIGLITFCAFLLDGALGDRQPSLR